MHRLTLALALGLSLASCQSFAQDIDDHWSHRSILPRFTRYATGYDAARDGDYKDFQYQRKQDINLTLARHFLNWNPDNPNHPEWHSRFEPRPPHSPLPNPIRYWHLEGLLFVGVPIDSLIGTLFTKDGPSEFMQGFGRTIDFDGDDDDDRPRVVSASYSSYSAFDEEAPVAIKTITDLGR